MYVLDMHGTHSSCRKCWRRRLEAVEKKNNKLTVTTPSGGVCTTFKRFRNKTQEKEYKQSLAVALTVVKTIVRYLFSVGGERDTISTIPQRPYKGGNTKPESMHGMRVSTYVLSGLRYHSNRVLVAKLAMIPKTYRVTTATKDLCRGLKSSHKTLNRGFSSY